MVTFQNTPLNDFFTAQLKSKSFTWKKETAAPRFFVKKYKNWVPKNFKRTFLIEKKLFKKTTKHLKTLFLKKWKKIIPADLNSKNPIKFKNNKNTQLINVFGFSKTIKFYCFFKLQKQVSQLYSKYFAIYFLGFSEFFFSKKTYIAWLVNHQQIETTNWLINYIATKYNFLRTKISANLFLKELLPNLFYSLELKDLTYFNSWLKLNIEKFPIKKHKTFLFYLKIILTSYFHVLKKLFNISGFFLDIRGKLSVTGNAKKRHSSISLGSFSKSNKNLKLDLKKNIIHTNTGVLGLTLILAYI